MCSSATDTANTALEGGKLVKFVELLVHDYLQAKGFTATAEKFAEECSKCARDSGGGSSRRKHRGAGSSVVSDESAVGNDGATVDDASCWYYLADKLALTVWVLYQPPLSFFGHDVRIFNIYKESSRIHRFVHINGRPWFLK